LNGSSFLLLQSNKEYILTFIFVDLGHEVLGYLIHIYNSRLQLGTGQMTLAAEIGGVWIHGLIYSLDRIENLDAN
jgi:hypothetical protein